MKACSFNVWLKDYQNKENKGERNWVFATNSDFVKPISLQSYGENLWYFKLTLFDLIAFIAWNIKDLRHWGATISKL